GILPPHHLPLPQLLHPLFPYLILTPPPRPTLFPYTTLFRSRRPAGTLDLQAFQRLRQALAQLGGIAGRAVRQRQESRLLGDRRQDRKSTRLNSSHVKISYAVFCLKKKKHKNNE